MGVMNRSNLNDNYNDNENKEINELEKFIQDVSEEIIYDFINDTGSCNGCSTTERCSSDICFTHMQQWLKVKRQKI